MLYRLIVLAIVGIGLVLTEVGCGSAQPNLEKGKGGAGVSATGAAGTRRVRVPN